LYSRKKAFDGDSNADSKLYYTGQPVEIDLRESAHTGIFQYILIAWTDQEEGIYRYEILPKHDKGNLQDFVIVAAHVVSEKNIPSGPNTWDKLKILWNLEQRAVDKLRNKVLNMPYANKKISPSL
jgi:hypothetical protein